MLVKKGKWHLTLTFSKHYAPKTSVNFPTTCTHTCNIIQILVKINIVKKSYKLKIILVSFVVLKLLLKLGFVDFCLELSLGTRITKTNE
jgi:hypothetical protein